MVRSAIKAHTTALLHGIVAQAEALSTVTHPTVKGELRELLISSLFSRFLVQDFGVGTGQIINQREELSNQIDIVIYDKRILPPFIQMRELGLFPAESVLAVIEVKSKLTKNNIIEASEKSRSLLQEVYRRDASIYRDLHNYRPLCCIIGFQDGLNFDYENNKENRRKILSWINENTSSMWSICLMNKFSWSRIMKKGGVVNLRSENMESTKAFLAILLDNIRSIANRRNNFLSQRPHIDWFSLYLREQDLETKFFSKFDS